MSGLMTIIIVISSLICLFTLGLILRYARLRTRTNKHIAELCVISVAYNVAALFLIFGPKEGPAFNKGIDSVNILGLLYTIICSFLIWDSIASIHEPNRVYWYPSRYTRVHIVVFFIVMFIWLSTIILQNMGQHQIDTIIQMILMSTYIILLFAVMGRIYKSRGPIIAYWNFSGYAIGLTGIVTFIIHFIQVLIIYFIDQPMKHPSFLYFLYGVWLAQPIMFFYKFLKTDRFFKMAVDKTFRRVENYSEDELAELEVRQQRPEVHQLGNIAAPR